MQYALLIKILDIEFNPLLCVGSSVGLKFSIKL